jgi:hypothetical protein
VVARLVLRRSTKDLSRFDRTTDAFGALADNHCVFVGTEMRIVIEVVVGWIVLSCTVGPVLTWMFFWGARRSIAIETAGQRSAPTYKSPSSKWRFTPAAFVLVLAIIGSLGVVLLRNGAAADADIIDMRRP